MSSFLLAVSISRFNICAKFNALAVGISTREIPISSKPLINDYVFGISWNIRGSGQKLKSQNDRGTISNTYNILYDFYKHPK